MDRPIVIISGGFDPLHSGHIALLEQAAGLGDVHVLLNSDMWLTKKKGRPFMPWDERAVVLQAIKHVTAVVAFDDGDGTACNGIYCLFQNHPSRRFIYCVGETKRHKSPETALCEGLGMACEWGVGGQKTQSSSHFLDRWQLDTSFG